MIYYSFWPVSVISVIFFEGKIKKKIEIKKQSFLRTIVSGLEICASLKRKYQTWSKYQMLENFRIISFLLWYSTIIQCLQLGVLEVHIFQCTSI